MSQRLSIYGQVAIALLATLGYTRSTQAEGSTLTPDVISGIEQAIESGKARAVAVGLYDNGEVHVTGFGHISRDNHSSPQGDTFFEIGSITKVFTSLLAQTQIDAGRLSWDDTIASRLPDVEFKSELVGAITLRELSSHTSGLPRMPDNFDPQDPLDPYKGYAREHMLSFLAALDPEKTVKEFAYSNLGAGLLGVIAADAAGLEYSKAIAKEVLGPLGMAETGTSLSEDQAPQLAQGFSEGADMPNWSGFDALAGAGALLSTVDEMLVFVRQNLEGNVMHKSLDAVRESQAAGDTAFGWILSDQQQDTVYWHNGGTGGYASFIAIRPEKGTGVVMLSASTEYGRITELGFAQLYGTQKSDGEVVVDLDAYPGVYQISEGFALSVFVDADALYAQATGQGAIPLTSSSANEFVYPAADIKIVFSLGADGLADKLTLYQGGQVLPAPRVGDSEEIAVREEIQVDESVLQDYVGEYELAPKAMLSVLVRNGQLFAQLTGQAAFPIFAYEADKFFYKVVDAQLHFERDESGVAAVVLHQGGEQRAPRIK